LIIADLASEIRVSRSAVARTFQLSTREAELAELFSTGLRVDAIAARMGISANTARIHLRNVFAKTGCANQVELARLFAHMP
jgi:DNA-binding CsgD family transcriptional regulator